VNQEEFSHLPPSQIVPTLADRGIYIASESTIYRILREANQLKHRGHSKEPVKRPGYLSRYIKKETGYNLSYLIREYRLSRAATMLRETRCSVEEIMYRVGYTDISYFYKVFKKKYQYTPNQFRKQLKIVRPMG
jgi:methylphosphotriester-DNA--protein-cysteine methyltransferase